MISSRLVARSILPTLRDARVVVELEAVGFHLARAVELFVERLRAALSSFDGAFTTIERNFNIPNGLLPSPTRVWRNSTGPGLVNLIASAINASSGEITMSKRHGHDEVERALRDRYPECCGWRLGSW